MNKVFQVIGQQSEIFRKVLDENLSSLSSHLAGLPTLKTSRLCASDLVWYGLVNFVLLLVCIRIFYDTCI